MAELNLKQIIDRYSRHFFADRASLLSLDLGIEEKKEKIREELADVLNYRILMADTSGLDLDEIIREKVRKNAEKYPV